MNFKKEMSPRIAQLILNIKEALIQDNHDDAWYNLYQVVTPDFDNLTDGNDKGWSELEKYALSEQIANEPTDEDIYEWACYGYDETVGMDDLTKGRIEGAKAMRDGKITAKETV